MGAINNAFNQAAGAAAGAALAIKHAKETDFSKMISAENSALIARNQSSEADVAAKEAKLEEDKTMDDFLKAMSDKIDKSNKYEKAKSRKNASPKTVNKKYTELKAADQALESLSNKIDGLEAMQKRAEEQRYHAAAATERAKKAIHKYDNKWGIE